MQATVSRFDDQTGDGDVLLDDGLELPFKGDALRGTGLRLLRPGQRVRIERDDTGTIIDQGDHGVFDLQVGDCFTDDAAAPMTPDETIAVKSVEAIPCDDEHGAEVFANVDLPDGEFPGDVQMSDRATTLCFDEFEPYVGAPYESSEYDYGWFAPTEEPWSRGDGTFNCVLFRTDGGLSSGSARGSGR